MRQFFFFRTPVLSVTSAHLINNMQLNNNKTLNHTTNQVQSPYFLCETQNMKTQRGVLEMLLDYGIRPGASKHSLHRRLRQCFICMVRTTYSCGHAAKATP